MAITFGDMIRARRKQLGITQTMLGKQIGVTKQAVSQWENNQISRDNIKGVNLIQLFRILKFEDQSIVMEDRKRYLKNSTAFEFAIEPDLTNYPASTIQEVERILTKSVDEQEINEENKEVILTLLKQLMNKGH